LSRTPGDGSRPLPQIGADARTVLSAYGFDSAEISRLSDSGAIG
jgi:crotonobetainyl-CoA:carnitine CoA-transferase CaiB-like acyl-CoA transferase